MGDVEHFSFQGLCAKLAAATCEANVQWNHTRSRVECFFRSRTIHAPELKSFSYTVKSKKPLPYFKIKLYLETERCVQFFVSKRKIFRVADADDFGIEMSIVDCIQLRWHSSRGPVTCDILKLSDTTCAQQNWLQVIRLKSFTVLQAEMSE